MIRRRFRRSTTTPARGPTRARGSICTINIQANPERPDEAIVDSDMGNRGMVWVAGIALLAACIALAFTWLLFELWRTPLDVALRRQPRVPEARASLVVSWVMALLWNGFMLPLVIFVVPDLIDDGEWVGLAFLSLFVLIGLLILTGAILGTWRSLLSLVRGAT